MIFTANEKSLQQDLTRIPRANIDETYGAFRLGFWQKIKKKGTARFDKEPRGKYRRKILYDIGFPRQIQRKVWYDLKRKGFPRQWKKVTVRFEKDQTMIPAASKKRHTMVCVGFCDKKRRAHGTIKLGLPRQKKEEKYGSN